MIDEFELLRRVGSNVRSARVTAGISQGQLADLIGVRRTSITNVEAGRQNVDVFRLFCLAEALSVAPWMLLPRLGEVGA